MRVHGKKVWNAVRDRPVTILAANTRIEHSIKPIFAAAQDEESVVAIELAKTESFDPCYSGIGPEELNKLTKEYASEVGDPVYFLHEDHNTYGRGDDPEEEWEKTLEFRDLGIENEYTSFSVDASYLPLQENLEAAKKIARPIVEKGLGLEVEVGEIKGEEEITRVGEALYFVESLKEEGIDPDVLAISNGSVHGHYGEGELPHIHLRRTYDIARAIRKEGVSGIAQHGTTGTPNIILDQFSEHGIKKANVATNFQDIAVENMPESLVEEMEDWKEENDASSVKYAFKEFKDEIADLDQKYVDKIYDATYERAKELIRFFNSQGSAKLVK
ncbi:MAG: class II fructose-bisphosphate aldolase [Candidatus Hadarchaeia archaeon]